MADVVVVEDLTAGGEYEKNKDGDSFVRTFLVSGLDDNVAYAKLSSAASAPGIPRYHDKHPSSGYSWVTDISARLADEGAANIVIVTIKYGPWDGENSQIEAGSTIIEKETNKDFLDHLLTLYHEREQVVPVEGSVNTEKKIVQDPPEIAIVKIQLPQSTVRVTRTESKNPLENSKLYVGKINSKDFLGDKKHYWLCVGISGGSDDGGESYKVTYEFQRNEDTWNPVVSWIDPVTKEPPNDPPQNPPKKPTDCVNPPRAIPEKDGYGKACSLARVRIYEEADFSTLDLKVDRDVGPQVK